LKLVNEDMRLLSLLIVIVVFSLCVGVSAQNRGPRQRGSVCGNPQVPCKTSAQFQPYDLPFRLSANSVIYDTELFYAIILKSVGSNENDCENFVTESVRLEAQALFPNRKVFTSRCPDIETLAYTNVSRNHRFMAVYAGATMTEAKKVLAAVNATGKFQGAMIHRMRTGFNGT